MAHHRQPTRVVELPVWMRDLALPTESDRLRAFATDAFASVLGERSTWEGILATWFRGYNSTPPPPPKDGRFPLVQTLPCHGDKKHTTRGSIDHDGIPDSALRTIRLVARVSAGLRTLAPHERAALLAFYRVTPRRDLAEAMGADAFEAMWARLRPFVGVVAAARFTAAARLWTAERPALRDVDEALNRLGSRVLLHQAGPHDEAALRRMAEEASRLLVVAQHRAVTAMRAARADERRAA